MGTIVHDPLEGRLLDGRYAVRSKVARGGMATVYLALDRRLGRDVALKIMHHHLADDESFTSRFLREARSAARLSHPNVVQVYDQGSDGNLYYLAMEYLPGRTLREVLVERGVLTPREALTVFEPILDALSAAHRAGIVHRDVKPENVILTDDGRVKVADFGLARGASTSAATTGQLMGTVAYLSPELVTRGVADTRSDVYAAGILLFEMLTGCQPFTGDIPIQVAYRHVHERVPAPSRLVPTLPVELDDLVLLAAANDPERRPATAGELLAMVRPIHARLPAALLDARPRRPVAGQVDAAAMSSPPVAPAGDDARTALVTSAPGPQPTRTLPGGVPRAPVGQDADPISTSRRRSARVRHDLPSAALDAEHAELLQLGERRRRRGWIGLVAVLAVAALLGGVAGWFTIGPGAFRSVPPLRTLTLAEAQQRLATQGLQASTKNTHDDTALPGTVIDTRPPAGQRVRRGGTVVLFICDGPARVTVPKVVGMTVDDAVAALKENFLTVSGDRNLQYDDNAPKGTVLSASPAPDAQVANGTSVQLTISNGPQPVDLPSFVGAQQDDAVNQLQQLGLKPAIQQAFSDTVPQGQVISQDPPGGEGKTALHGGTVTLTVSLGPQLFPVPDVFGKGLPEATKILQDAGFGVSVNRFLGGVFGTVRSQNPAAKSQQPKGTVITLTVV